MKHELYIMLMMRRRHTWSNCQYHIHRSNLVISKLPFHCLGLITNIFSKAMTKRSVLSKRKSLTIMLHYQYSKIVS
ncbi:hypothetical protein BLA29_007265 [Euroglyphus maynei]|uniref:Uncharacterized protein n=1 Tax=Euroglyphus maynei TaxID=6958 RepID=A0A1Y3BDS0_EURMA|nr:hypothetical protein BLA29_007265 [Euroglyphus maynei]